MIFLLLLLIHLLGDFYLSFSKKIYVNHIIYLLLSCILILPFYTHSLLISAIAFSILHAMFDMVKVYLSHILPKIQRILFFCYQIVHILAILIISIINNGSVVSSSLYDIDFHLLLRWAVMILLMLKPSNTVIKYFLQNYKPYEGDAVSGTNAGSLIGSIERLLILSLISIGQYAAIGLVLTAKSIARYKKINEEKAFGEYYLLGTLISTLIVISSFHLII